MVTNSNSTNYIYIVQHSKYIYKKKPKDYPMISPFIVLYAAQLPTSPTEMGDNSYKQVMLTAVYKKAPDFPFILENQGYLSVMARLNWQKKRQSFDCLFGGRGGT